MVKEITNQAITNSLLGLMVGDTIGLPYEGLSSRRIAKLQKGQPLKQSFLFGKAMVSDDTEHAVITAKSLCHTTNAQDFGKSLAWGLRWWFSRLPAGMGLATGRAIIKLCLGFSYRSSGVFSAGNGPAMRAPILGVVFGGNDESLKEYVNISTTITHTDPKAYIGALAIAKISYMSSQNNYSLNEFEQSMQVLLKDIEGNAVNEFWGFLNLLNDLDLEDEKSIDTLLVKLNLEKGVTGYINHTLPFVLALFFVYKKDYLGAVNRAIRCGGDTDTTAAIIGGVIGAGVNKADIPNHWLSNIIDYPCNAKSLDEVAGKLFDRINHEKIVRNRLLIWPVVMIRNFFFLIVVLLHGFRRLLPPY